MITPALADTSESALGSSSGSAADNYLAQQDRDQDQDQDQDDATKSKKTRQDQDQDQDDDGGDFGGDDTDYA